MRKKNLGICNEYTWKHSYENVKHFSLGLISIGLKEGEKVLIIGDNEPEVSWAQLAVGAALGTVTECFSDSIPSEVQYIATQSNSSYAVVNDQEQIDKFLQIKDELPSLKKIIYWDPKGLQNYDDPLLLSFKEVLKCGKEYAQSHPSLFEENVAKGDSEDIAFIYYTSGTSGLPKGAMISHRALINSSSYFLSLAPCSEKDEYFSLFPVGSIGYSLFGIVPHLLNGPKLNFPEEPETVQEDIREIGPQTLIYGPRQWESLTSTVRVKINDTSPIRRLLYNLFLPLCYRRADLAYRKTRPSPLWRFLTVLGEAIVFRPLKDRMGLSKSKIAITGSAAMGSDTFRFWSAMGIRLRQVYASTEAGFISAHDEDNIRFETVGQPLVQTRLSDEGEVLVTGDCLFSGYYNNPARTADVLIDGWFHTGDAAYINDEGHIIFLDRLADMKELASGAKYAPQHIESRLRFSPFIKDAVVIGGSDKEYVSAILNIDFENVGKWAENHRIPYTTFVDLSQKEETAELARKDVERVNRDLPNQSRIRKYVLLHKEFDADESELTRTRKVRRTFFEERYSNLLEAIYCEGTEEVPVEAGVTYRDGRKGMVKTALRIRSV